MGWVKEGFQTQQDSWCVSADKEIAALDTGPCQPLMSSRAPGRSILGKAAPFEHWLLVPHDIISLLLPAGQHLPAHDGVLESFVERAALCEEASKGSNLLSQQSRSVRVEPSRA